jgi:Immunity protein 50
MARHGHGRPEFSLHDAKVVRLVLEREEGEKAKLVLVIRLDPQPDPEHALITFNGVSDVELDGWNEQNVLFDLLVGEAEDGRWDVTLQTSYGLAGTLRCDSISWMHAETAA